MSENHDPVVAEGPTLPQHPIFQGRAGVQLGAGDVKRNVQVPLQEG